MKKSIKLIVATMLLIIVACFFCVSCVNDNDNPNPGGNNGGNEPSQKKEVDMWVAKGVEGEYYPSENYYQSLWGQTQYHHNYDEEGLCWQGYALDWQKYMKLSEIREHGHNIKNVIFKKDYDIHKIEFWCSVRSFPHITYMNTKITPWQAYGKYYAIDSIKYKIEISTTADNIIYTEEQEIDTANYEYVSWSDFKIIDNNPTPIGANYLSYRNFIKLDEAVSTDRMTITVSVIDLKIKEGYEDMASKQEVMKYYQETLSAHITPYTYI
jgi:hypothetical protein